MSHGVSPIPVEIARELARQGEARLNAVLTLSTLAVTRATTLCGIFGAASVGLGAAVLAYLGTDHHSGRLVWSGSVAALLLFASAIVAATAGLPRTFRLPGGEPLDLRAWALEGSHWCSESEMLDATAQRFAEALRENRQLLEWESRVLVGALVLGFASVLIGALIYILYPRLS